MEMRHGQRIGNERKAVHVRSTPSTPGIFFFVCSPFSGCSRMECSQFFPDLSAKMGILVRFSANFSRLSPFNLSNIHSK